ncbi:MAG TPA: hypothetical protein VLY65_02860 [Nitrososphaerales archaeon]|nr:hypothetical protein [Nitrososphaerales archaeon]
MADPFVLVDQFAAQGKLKPAMAAKIKARADYLLAAVGRVEKATGLRYPPYYVEPTLPLAVTSVEYGSIGAFFARVIPAPFEGRLSIIVQFTAPLLLFGAKGTIEAVAGHEFTHYVDLVRRLSSMNIVSDERVSTLYEAGHADEERLINPKKVFANDKPLAKLIDKKFTPNLTDPKLDEKVSKNWIGKGLPSRRVTTEDNFVKLDIQMIARTSFDPSVIERIKAMESAPVKPSRKVKGA